ncbi:NAD(P)H:quinone oxidoreductase [Nocardioides nematodiphilus]|uniref:NAD(P)H:quinone oxidoreductase n=1 Tax=Nocardioides nematodiphilus TaxID=2849669 RepID=UPI001CD9873B|nr:NAD(P)H:quinone oxidoreductase [Nocardioides nematodiphilus]MCA1982179.1 NAD(P)H:quinone oxidoreductase [Nocardioides nematodiphilus]
MTEKTKVAIIYYSSTGTTAEVARELNEAALGAGAEVRLRKVPELAPMSAIEANPAWAENHLSTAGVPEATPADVEWADVVLFGTPTRFGNVSAQLKQFMDTLGGLWAAGQLADKVYSGFVSSSSLHGGQETTLQSLYTFVHHFGGVLVAPGFTDPIKFDDGNPYGTSHVDGQGTRPVDDVTRASAKHQARRVIDIARRLNAGRALA